MSKKKLKEDPCCDSSKHTHFYRCWRSMFFNLVLYFLLCALTVIVSQQYPQTLLTVQVELSSYIIEFALPLLALFTAVVLARPLCLVYDAHHEIRCHHLYSITGICSLRKKNIDLAYEDLRGVHVNQTIIDRVLNVGTLVVGSAMTGDPEIIMPGISRPKKYAALIMEKIDDARKKFESDRSFAP